MMIGKDAGKQGKIVRVRPTDAQVLVEGLNIMKRHRKPRKQGEKGEIISVPRFVSVANVMIVCPACRKPARMGYKIIQPGPLEVGVGAVKKLRICKKCATEIH